MARAILDFCNDGEAGIDIELHGLRSRRSERVDARDPDFMHSQVVVARRPLQNSGLWIESSAIGETGGAQLHVKTLGIHCRDSKLDGVSGRDGRFSGRYQEGRAELSEEPADLVRTATAIGGRYMGPERAVEFGKRNGVPGELVVRIRPTKVLATFNMTG